MPVGCMTEVLNVFDTVHSARMISYVRLFSAEYVTLKSAEYESEYIETINETKNLGNSNNTYQINVTSTNASAVAQKCHAYMISFTTNIINICEVANKSCIIL